MNKLSPVVLGAAVAAVAAGCGGAYGSGSAPAAIAPTAATTKIARAHVTAGPSSLGRHLMDGRGRALYLFTADRGRRSTCYGQCAAIWPPLLTHGRPAAGAGARRSLLGTTRRRDGRTQVTYAGHPLYLFVSDTRRGQVSGEGVTHFGGTFLAVSPAGRALRKQAAATAPAQPQQQTTPPPTAPSGYGGY